MEIDLGTANPTGQVIISERDATNTLLTRMTLDLDGTLLGSPSWVIELVDQNNNIFSFNGLFVNQLFPLDVLLETTPEGFALARHKTVELGDLWFWDFGNGYQGVRDHITGDYWKIQPKGDEHVTGGPLTLDFSPNNFFIENLTLDFINVQQIPEPATLILLALGGLIGRRRRR